MINMETKTQTQPRQPRTRIRLPQSGSNPVGVLVVLGCPPANSARVSTKLMDMYQSFKKTRKNGLYGAARLLIEVTHQGLQLTFLPSQALDPYTLQADSVFFFDAKSASVCLDLQRLEVSLLSYSSHSLKVSRPVAYYR